MGTTIDLRTPAGTRDGLRAQAAALNIKGRGAMNKGALIEAISAELTRRAAQSLVDGTDGDIRVQPHDDGTTTVTVPADAPEVTSEPIEVPEAITFRVNVDSVNASLERTGKQFRLTPEDVRLAGMVPVTSEPIEVPEASEPSGPDHASLTEALTSHVVYGPVTEEDDGTVTEEFTIVRPKPSPATLAAILARKGAGFERTRTARKTYPAKSQGGKRGKRGGRK